MISKETLEQWKKLCDESSYGPWNVCETHRAVHARGGCLGAVTVSVPIFDSFEESLTDLNFIAESRTAMPQLIEAYEKLKLELDAAVEALGKVAKGHTILRYAGKFNSHGYALTTTEILVTPETEEARAVLAMIKRGEKNV